MDVLPVGHYPTGVAVAPDDSRVYVTNNDGAYAGSHPGTTTVIDPVTGTVIDTLGVGGCAIALSDNGDHVYLASSGYDATFTSKLSIVDIPSGRISAVPIQGTPNALAVNGDRVYVTDTWHSSIIQITARDVLVVDTDAANDPPTLTITELETHLFQVSADDPDNDEVTVTATQPFSGTIKVLGGGLFHSSTHPTQGRQKDSSITSQSPPTTVTAAS